MYISLCILTFILLVIRSGSRLIRLVVACCLIGPSFECPAQQLDKSLCFYFPAPRCGRSRLPLLAALAQGPSPQRHRLPLLPAPGIGDGGSGERGRRWGGGNEGVGYHDEWRRLASSDVGSGPVAAAASVGAGRGEGGWGGGMRASISVASAGQQRRRLLACRHSGTGS